MSFSNTYTLNLDIKKRMSNVIPFFRQGDTANLKFRIYDDGVLYNLSDFRRAELVFQRPDRTVIEGRGDLENGLINYNFAGPEIALIGDIKVIVTIYSLTSSVSIQPFIIHSYDNLREGEITNITILQDLIAQVSTGLIELNQNTATVTQLQSDYTTLYNNTEQAEAARVLAESARDSAETTRLNDEQVRLSNENAREGNETSRQTNESTRISNEQDRIDAEALRVQAYGNARAIVDGFTFLGLYSPTVNYVAYNVVEYNGSSYAALRPSLGVTPSDDGVDWHLVAQRGLDGIGSVSMVNGLSPNQAGNVNISSLIRAETQPSAATQIQDALWFDVSGTAYDGIDIENADYSTVAPSDISRLWIENNGEGIVTLRKYVGGQWVALNPRTILSQVVNPATQETLDVTLTNIRNTIRNEIRQIVEVNVTDYRALVLNNDWRNAFLMAFTQGDRIFVPKGEYSTSSITIPAGKEIYGDGPGTVITALGTTIFTASGSYVGNQVPLIQDMNDFSDVAAVQTASGFAYNQDVLLLGQRDCLTYADSGQNWTMGYATPNAQGLYFGEFLKVRTVSPNQLQFETNTIFPFYYSNNSRESNPNARASSTVQRVNFVENIKIRNMTLRNSVGRTITFTLARNCYVEDVTLIGDGYQDGSIEFIYFRNTIDCEGTRCKFRINEIVSPSQHHYINVYKTVSCMYSGFKQCESYNGSQPFDMTYAVGTFCSTGCYVEECKSDFSSQSGMTSHGGTYQTRFVNNIISRTTQGIANRSRNALITGNTIIGQIDSSNNLRSGITIYEGHANDCIVTNNNIANFYTGIVVADGSDIGEAFRYCGANISNNSIKNFTYGVRVIKNSSYLTNYMGIRIHNNEFNPSKVGEIQCVRLENSVTGVDITNNSFYALSSDTAARAIYTNYESTDITIKNNTFRQFSTAIFIRGRQNANSPAVRFIETDNNYIDVTTRINSASSNKRQDNAQFKNIRFVEQSSFADVTTNNTFFVYTDGNLYFKDNNGTNRRVTLT